MNFRVSKGRTRHLAKDLCSLAGPREMGVLENHWLQPIFWGCHPLCLLRVGSQSQSPSRPGGRGGAGSLESGFLVPCPATHCPSPRPTLTCGCSPDCSSESPLNLRRGQRGRSVIRAHSQGQKHRPSSLLPSMCGQISVLLAASGDSGPLTSLPAASVSLQLLRSAALFLLCSVCLILSPLLICPLDRGHPLTRAIGSLKQTENLKH